jgi:hypothetical protein
MVDDSFDPVNYRANRSLRGGRYAAFCCTVSQLYAGLLCGGTLRIKLKQNSIVQCGWLIVSAVEPGTF